MVMFDTKKITFKINLRDTKEKVNAQY